MHEDLIGAVIGIWVPLSFAYIRNLHASVEKLQLFITAKNYLTNYMIFTDNFLL